MDFPKGPQNTCLERQNLKGGTGQQTDFLFLDKIKIFRVLRILREYSVQKEDVDMKKMSKCGIFLCLE